MDDIHICIGDKVEIEGMLGSVIYKTEITATTKELILSAGNLFVAELSERKQPNNLVYQHIRKFDEHLVRSGYVKLLTP